MQVNVFLKLHHLNFPYTSLSPCWLNSFPIIKKAFAKFSGVDYYLTIEHRVYYKSSKNVSGCPWVLGSPQLNMFFMLV